MSLRPIRSVLPILAFAWIVLVCSVVFPSGLPKKDEADARERILNYLREKYGVSGSTKMTVRPFEEFSSPSFYRTSVAVESAGSQRNQQLFLTKDCRYVIVGDAYPLGANTNAEISRRIRKLANLSSKSRISVGPLRASGIPHLLLTRITVNEGGQEQARDFYLTEDRKALFVGEVFDLTSDPREEALRTISVRDCPTLGPADAPVTIVEFSDLQCTSCAQLDEFLRKELVPKYGGKVRVVFKEYPLERIHDWTLTGSIVTQCAAVLAPTTYVRLRALIFENQDHLNAHNARDRLLALGEQAGVNRTQLTACVDSGSTLPRIRKDLAEGEAMDVRATPTSFVNGHRILGMPSKSEYYKAVDDALRAAK